MLQFLNNDKLCGKLEKIFIDFYCISITSKMLELALDFLKEEKNLVNLKGIELYYLAYQDIPQQEQNKLQKNNS